MGRQTNYDESEARVLLNLAAASYGKQQIACLSRSFPQHQKRVILHTQRMDCDRFGNNCVGFIVHSPIVKELIVVFRGTKGPKQLLLEGWDSLEPGIDFFDMGMINKYFMNAHLSLWPGTEKVLSDSKYSDHRVIFTGHSLGGALAALAAARTVLQGYRNGTMVKVVTFGQPRVGNVRFAQSYDRIMPNSFRVVFRRDIVPHLPTCRQVTDGLNDGSTKVCDSNNTNGPYHHGTEIWYPDSMEPGSNYVECLGGPRHEDMRCSNQVFFIFDQVEDYVYDHRHYFGKLIAAFGKLGCNEAFPEGEPSLFERALTKINLLAKSFGLR